MQLHTPQNYVGGYLATAPRRSLSLSTSISRCSIISAISVCLWSSCSSIASSNSLLHPAICVAMMHQWAQDCHPPREVRLVLNEWLEVGVGEVGVPSCFHVFPFVPKPNPWFHRWCLRITWPHSCVAKSTNQRLSAEDIVNHLLQIVDDLSTPVEVNWSFWSLHLVLLPLLLTLASLFSNISRCFHIHVLQTPSIADIGPTVVAKCHVWTIANYAKTVASLPPQNKLLFPAKLLRQPLHISRNPTVFGMGPLSIQVCIGIWTALLNIQSKWLLWSIPPKAHLFWLLVNPCWPVHPCLLLPHMAELLQQRPLLNSSISELDLNVSCSDLLTLSHSQPFQYSFLEPSHINIP